ncbi:hypothetical protein AB0G74_26325 [Streptomyces sp. NPDC020875]|uniref:hypothetical protein n=1 Tax=Streptomyces sp. NPDC020875 TaxID=3154898 RepID=UPI0033FB226D
MAVFHEGTTFQGSADYPIGMDPGWVSISFSVRNEMMPPSTPQITPLEIAAALNTLVQSKGYPRIVFSGTPVAEPLNP